MPDQTPKAVHSNPSRCAPLLTLLDHAADPANLLLIPVLCGCVAVIAAQVNVRLAALLTATAVLLLATRMRRAVTVATLLLCAFAAVALMHVPQLTTPPVSSTAVGVSTPRDAVVDAVRDTTTPR